MNTFLFSTYDTWSTRNPYRMGNVGMSSSMVSMVSFYSAICMMFSQVRAPHRCSHKRVMGSVDARVDLCARRQNSIVMPLQQKNGFPFAFTVGAYGGAISHFLEGVSWIGGYAQRMSVYTLSVTIECLIFECCGHCIRPMITASAATVGLGL